MKCVIGVWVSFRVHKIFKVYKKSILIYKIIILVTKNVFIYK